MFRYLPLISTILTIVFTSLVSIPGSPYLINGTTQAEISDMFPTSITPAGITFAIWSIIYLGWIISSLMVSGIPFTGLTKKYFPKITSLLTYTLDKKLSILYSLAIALTAVWLIPWGYILPGVSLIIIIIILGILFYIFLQTLQAPKVFRYSIELFLGWIIIATFANFSVWLQSIGFPYGGPDDLYYAIFAIGAILLVVSELQCRYMSYVISGVFLWTMLGEWIAHTTLEYRVMLIIYVLTLSLYIWNSLHGRCTTLRTLKFW